ncbi:MAG: glutaredoxin family protein [Verrucomicrobiota bacterium]
MKLELYTREWCPWCGKARATLDRLGYAYIIHDLEVEEGARETMAAISGQERVPTLKVGDLVLPDFGPDDLLAFLEKHEITPEKSHQSE